MKKFNKDKYLKQLQLKKFYQKYERYFYIGISCLLVFILGIYFAYSKFTTTADTEVVRTTVGDFIQGDIVLTPYIDGTYSKAFPKDEVGYNAEKVTCDNGATGTWDSFNWKLKVTGMTKRTKCNVYFVTPASCGVNDNVNCISTREELATLATEVNNGDTKSGKIYYLTSDIDLGGKFDSDGNALDGNTSWTPIGTQSNPFSGIFDGNAHIISNMYVNRASSNYNGLFGAASNSVIKNLGLKSSYVIGDSRNAGILGGATKNTMIASVYNSSTVSGNYRSAGICSEFCTVKNSYNTANIINNSSDIIGGIAGGWSNVYNSYNLGNVNGAASVGGISGWNSNIYNSYNLGNAEGTNKYWVGGILGASDGLRKIIGNYNSGTISGGGILGRQENINNYNEITLTVEKNYYLSDSAPYGLYAYKENYGAEPLSADEMPSVISVINGENAFAEDTNNINNGYPILKWQAERENN